MKITHSGIPFLQTLDSGLWSHQNLPGKFMNWESNPFPANRNVIRQKSRMAMSCGCWKRESGLSFIPASLMSKTKPRMPTTTITARSWPPMRKILKIIWKNFAVRMFILWIHSLRWIMQKRWKNDFLRNYVHNTIFLYPKLNRQWTPLTKRRHRCGKIFGTKEKKPLLTWQKPEKWESFSAEDRTISIRRSIMVSLNWLIPMVLPF